MAVPFLKTTLYTAYDSSRIRDGGEEQIDNLLTWNEVSEKRPKSHFYFWHISYTENRGCSFYLCTVHI